MKRPLRGVATKETIPKYFNFSVDAKVVVSDGSPQDREGGDQLPSDIFNVYEANNNMQYKFKQFCALESNPVTGLSVSIISHVKP